tara:strand:- start:100 stop:528 length:429 start_codon:yes stop_codon:yes gene_type:complete
MIKQHDGSIYWEKSDMRSIKDGTNEAFRKIENPELDAVNIVAYEEIDKDRVNAILFSTRKEARGATYIWWSTAFQYEQQRDEAIANTIKMAKIGFKHTAFKFSRVAPSSMAGRGFAENGFKDYFATKEYWEKANQYGEYLYK